MPFPRHPEFADLAATPPRNPFLGLLPWPEQQAVTRALCTETVGGLVLLAAAVVALVWANTPLSSAYPTIRDSHFGIPALGFDLSVGHWTSDGLLTVCAYATACGRILIDRCLCLPASWTDDRERCRWAGIDDRVVSETKVAVARAMVRRTVQEKIRSGGGPRTPVTAVPEPADRAGAGGCLPCHGHQPAPHRRHSLGHGPSRS